MSDSRERGGFELQTEAREGMNKSSEMRWSLSKKW